MKYSELSQNTFTLKYAMIVAAFLLTFLRKESKVILTQAKTTKKETYDTQQTWKLSNFNLEIYSPS